LLLELECVRIAVLGVEDDVDKAVVHLERGRLPHLLNESLHDALLNGRKNALSEPFGE